MKKRNTYLSFFPLVCLILSGFVVSAVLLSRSVTVMSESTPVDTKTCIIIDAGHGGVDGGATSCTGAQESQMNLQIAQRLDDLLHLLGADTKMVRDSDISVYTSGQTIAEKKISDLKERVRIVNSEENAILVSIHMNHFTDNRYSGAQVFYAPTQGSETLAKQLQSAFKETLNPTSTRQIKKADGIYLMQHIQCPGVLVECGFISNHEENAKLNDPGYQQKLCSVIATNLCSFLSNA